MNRYFLPSSNPALLSSTIHKSIYLPPPVAQIDSLSYPTDHQQSGVDVPPAETRQTIAPPRPTGNFLCISLLLRWSLPPLNHRPTMLTPFSHKVGFRCSAWAKTLQNHRLSPPHLFLGISTVFNSSSPFVNHRTTTLTAQLVALNSGGANRRRVQRRCSTLRLHS
ncbi:unnamed protein product [Lactuca virosa]|uniref:Uncharacterized protein n=1 Tax=Lactuca virosa TaxID=75947 RepID=A0AAU9MTH4_9ASTR|nr:unnamed protein product [Lactuca virosa]